MVCLINIVVRSSSGEDTGLSRQQHGFDPRTDHHFKRGDIMWIKMKDQKPEEGQKVIYYFRPVGVHRGVYNRGYEEEYGHYDCFSGKGGFLTDDVTHWMPDHGGELPLKPTTENGDV